MHRGKDDHVSYQVLGKQGYSFIMTGRDRHHVWGSFRIPREADQTVSYLDPVMAGLHMDCGWERLEPSYGVISESTFGPILVGLTSGLPKPWSKGIKLGHRPPQGP